MKLLTIRVVALGAVATVGCYDPGLDDTTTTAVSTIHTRGVVRDGTATAVGRLPSTRTLTLDLVLPVRDPAGLEACVASVTDPASPSCGHYLSVQDFTDRFGPTQADYDDAIAFAAGNGLVVTGGTRDAMDIQVTGTVSAIEAAFHVVARRLASRVHRVDRGIRAEL